MNYDMEDLVPVVRELAVKFTSGESTSVSYQNARKLMGAVIYCIREWEREQADACAGVTGIKEPPEGKLPEPGEAYRLGYQCVLEKVKRTQILYNKTAADFHAYGIKAYSETFERGIPSFFIHYDAAFCPQDHILTLDYPVLAALEQLTGIDRIAAYLNCIHLEQMFLGNLPVEYIQETLERFHPDFEELYLNAAATVRDRMLLSLYAGKGLLDPPLCDKDRRPLTLGIAKTSKEQLETAMISILDELIKTYYGNNGALRQYLSMGLSDFVVRLRLSAAHEGGLGLPV